MPESSGWLDERGHGGAEHPDPECVAGLHDLIYSFEPEEAGAVISSWIADRRLSASRTYASYTCVRSS